MTVRHRGTSAQLGDARHAPAALLRDAEQARLLRRLPPPLPVRLRRPSDPAQGPGLGAQHGGRGGARRAPLVVGPAGGEADDGGRPPAALRGLVAERLPGRRAGRALARPRGRLADRLRPDAGPDRRARGQRADGRRHHRAAGAVRPGRPDRPARRRAGRRRLQDRARALHRRRGPRLTGAGRLRPRRPAHAPPSVQPRRAAPPAQRHGGRVRAHRAVAGQPRAPGRGHRRRHHRGHRGDGGRGGAGRRLPGRPGRAVQLVRLPAQLPDRPGRRRRRGRRGASSPRTTT